MGMTELAVLDTGHRKINVLHIAGEVAEARKWSVTEVSGGGGGGTITGTNGQVYGNVSSAPITSTTTQHDQFFVRCTDGKDRILKLVNQNVQARSGHWVTLLLGIPAGKEGGDYVAVFNHDTDTFRVLPNAIDDLCASKTTKFRALLAVIATLAAAYWLVRPPFMWWATGHLPMNPGQMGLVLKTALLHPWLALLVTAVPLPAFFIWRSRLRKAFTEQVRALKGRIADPRPA